MNPAMEKSEKGDNAGPSRDEARRDLSMDLMGINGGRTCRVTYQYFTTLVS